MCNLYKMTKTTSEVAKWFEAVDAARGSNFAEELFPGSPGLVIAGGEIRSMIWGFPLVLKSKKTGAPLKPKAVNNTRSDKLDSYMWRYSFEDRRCLIPLTAWAEAEGKAGSKTRTWLSLPDEELFAVAGIWRESAEWGACFSMVMTDAAGDAAEVHNRMPVLLRPDDYGIWTSATAEEAKALCRPWPGNLGIERTAQLWSAR